ncbi:MAG: NfeD family protein [Parachlamydiales bacterium]
MIWGGLMIGVGLLLIILEFFLPGGIMGAAGGLLYLMGLVAFALNSPSLILTLAVVAVAVAALFLAVWITLKRMRESKSETPIFLKSDQEGYKASAWASELVGKEGTVRSDLKPAGHVLIEGQRYQALSRGGYLPQGAPIVVIGGQGAHLIVKEKKP